MSCRKYVLSKKCPSKICPSKKRPSKKRPGAVVVDLISSTILSPFDVVETTTTTTTTEEEEDKSLFQSKSSSLQAMDGLKQRNAFLVIF